MWHKYIYITILLHKLIIFQAVNLGKCSSDISSSITTSNLHLTPGDTLLHCSLHCKPPGEFQSLEWHLFLLSEFSSQFEAEYVHVKNRVDEFEGHRSVSRAELKSKDITCPHQDTLVHQRKYFLQSQMIIVKS